MTVDWRQTQACAIKGLGCHFNQQQEFFQGLNIKARALESRTLDSSPELATKSLFGLGPVT